MTELKHWLDESSDADDFERAILRADRAVDPPPWKQEEVWAGIVGALAIAPAAAATTLSAGASNTVLAAAGKAGAVWLGVAKGFARLGAKVIASAGGAQKVEYLRSLGVEQVIDYRNTSDLTRNLHDLAPQGIDAYFDNVGGQHLDAALASARNFARFALCGMISDYNGAGTAPQNLLMAIEKRLILQGFLVSDHLASRAAFIQQMNQWITSGEVTVKETVEFGIEQAPAAFLKLFSGGNVGKMLVKL